jgi:carbamoyl-phosphate synthase small subunit
MTIQSTPASSHSPHAHSAANPTPRLARLALANGVVYHGTAFGAVGVTTTAEVVFNTAISGYQESLTDPSYTGQILVQAFTMIGNTGVNAEDEESRKIQVSGLVVRELAARYSNFRADESLSDYLARHGVLGISGLDTRAIVRTLRSTGSIAGVITDAPAMGTNAVTDLQLVELARSAPSMAGQNLVPRVGCASSGTWSETLGEWDTHVAAPVAETDATDRLRVLTLDCGAKANILRNLAERNCEVIVVPHDTPPDEILRRFEAGEIDGLFISNGPGDPAAVERTVASLRQIIAKRSTMPAFGICLGHQLLALAAGAKTYKLKFGHRGINQPILNRETGKVEITSQNHGFAVDPDSLMAAGGEVTHVHLNDQTVAGFKMRDLPIFSVQYHPEASPGPHEAAYLFDRFVELMRAARTQRTVSPA